MEPPARFRRSLFGYSPRSVRTYITSLPEPVPPTPEAQALVRDLRALQDELEGAHAELARRSTALRSAEAATAEAQRHAREAEQQVAGLEADLHGAMERFDRRGEELRASEERAEALTSKLGALRTALTAEIQKVWVAETRVHEIGTDLGSTRERLHRTENELAVERTRAADAEARARAAERDAQRRNDPWTTNELTPVFDLAERTVVRIIAEARRRGDEELRQVQDEVARLHEEARHLESWRSRVEPLVVPVQRSVEQAQVEAERVGGLIRQTLEPMTSAVATLGERLVDLAAAASTAEDERPGAEEAPGLAHRPIVDLSEERADHPPG